MQTYLSTPTTWRWPRLRLRWAALALALFLANGVWRAVTVALDLRASGLSTRIWEPLVWELSSSLVVWALLPLIMAVVENAPWRKGGRLRFLGFHALGCLLFWGFHVAGMWGLRIWVYRWSGWGPYDYGRTAYRVPMEGFKDLISFAGLALLFHLLEARRARQARDLAAARLEAELREARLQALSAQLDPHFLFNALNTLSSLMYEDLPKADHLITALGQMLRDGLQAEGPTWPLDRELEHLQHYLAFAEARFGDRLQVEQAIAPGLGRLPVPRFALQRLVENALKHNEGTPGRVLRVRVEVQQHGGLARLSVSDDGVGFLDAKAGGLGLDNLRRSLALLHGDMGTLDVGEAPGGGARVGLSLPVEAAHG
ncbi:sensor histidine kinase [Geothrix sp. PMB-07]|uniref:sensor histidine kinase n=1 Tax=Geothrix sp. PMB-07 TaxID=3068640 RepID=UPI0027425A52|nr:histidine kinase [Geothrix sp. PMB-07]WLT33079.1 histidine kinase [Geothrix sp. PMB-07]